VIVRDHAFQFDHVYGPEVQQPQIYADLGGPIVQHALRGFNGTILAYGQTGSGKTFTVRSRRARAPPTILPWARPSLPADTRLGPRAALFT
jgi:excinuclease UvrABC helicase subunit UvrB